MTAHRLKTSFLIGKNIYSRSHRQLNWKWHYTKWYYRSVWISFTAGVLFGRNTLYRLSVCAKKVKQFLNHIVSCFTNQHTLVSFYLDVNNNKVILWVNCMRNNLQMVDIWAQHQSFHWMWFGQNFNIVLIIMKKLKPFIAKIWMYRNYLIC